MITFSKKNDAWPLENVKKKINEKINIRRRVSFSLPFLILVFLYGLIALILYLFLDLNTTGISFNNKILYLFYCAFFGSVGGFLSIVINIKKIEFNPYEEKKYMCIIVS